MSDRQRGTLRRAFRSGNRGMLLWWRLGWGRLLRGRWRGWTMVLVTRGHRSGVRRFAPVNFDREPNAVTCVASFGASTHWYRNLRADPRCELWLPQARWSGTAVPVSEEAERRRVLRRVLLRGGLAIRVFERLDPSHLTEEELGLLLERYEPVRIELREPLAGRAPGGPGDLAWVGWTVAGTALGPLLAGQARRLRLLVQQRRRGICEGKR